MTSHVITKDELIEMLKPFDGHEKICIKIDPKSIPDSEIILEQPLEEDKKNQKPRELMVIENLADYQFMVDAVKFDNASHNSPRLVLEAFTE